MIREWLAAIGPLLGGGRPRIGASAGGMNGDDKVARMRTVWNPPWAIKELGWK